MVLQDDSRNYFRYLPVSERDARWELYATGAGYCNVLPGERPHFPPHPGPYRHSWQTGRILPEYEILYIVRGEVFFESAPTGLKKVTAGDVLLLFPGVWHRTRAIENVGMEKYWVAINGEHMHHLVQQRLISSQAPVLQAGTKNSLLDAFLGLLDRVKNEHSPHPYLMGSIALEILASAFAAAKSKSDPQDYGEAGEVTDRLVGETLRLIYEHSHRGLNVEELVSWLPVTRRTLERRFRQARRRTVLEEITHCRLDRSKRLLVETDLSIQQVTAAAGFATAEQMGQLFRRSEGLSPSAYRRTHRQVPTA